MKKLDKDLALLTSLALAFVGANTQEDFPDDILDELSEILEASDWVLDSYKEGTAESIVIQDVIKAIYNLQITVEEYEALEREDY